MTACRLRNRRLDVVDDRRRHEVGAALLIEAIRRLDLAHLGARGNVDRKRILDELVFLDRRLQQVDPHAIAGQRSARLMHLQAFAVRFVDDHHALELRRLRRSLRPLWRASYACAGGSATAARRRLWWFLGSGAGKLQIADERALVSRFRSSPEFAAGTWSELRNSSGTLESFIDLLVYSDREIRSIPRANFSIITLGVTNNAPTGVFLALAFFAAFDPQPP